MTSPPLPPTQSEVKQPAGWLSWSYWTGAAVPSPSSESSPAPTTAQKTSPDSSSAGPSSSSTASDVGTSTSTVAPTTHQDLQNIPVTQGEMTGLDRIRQLYQTESMEVDVCQRVIRMTFLGGFLMGGSTGYVQARQTYEMNNVGRKYLSPSDAVKRRMDYAIVRFAKGGFGMGFKCAFISGSIVVLTTHLAAYRQSFSSLYFPALSGLLAVALHSALVGGVFAFPLGLVGAAKATGLGITSGLTLSAVVHLYAMGIDKSVDESYWMFKREYEKELADAAAWDSRVAALMASEGIRWRQTAVRRLKEQDAHALSTQDA